jgi:hypothetical protein
MYPDNAWMSGAIGDICQGVQRSAYPERYQPTTGQWNIESLHRGVQLLASHQYGGGSDLPATTLPTGL